MNDFKNIQVYSDVNGILSIDGDAMGETSSPLCFLLPPKRALMAFSPLCRAENGFYLGFSRMGDFSGDVPHITADDGVLRLTAYKNTVIADIYPPFLPEQPCPPHILKAASHGRYRATLYWDRWITFSLENDKGEIIYARALLSDRQPPESANAKIHFRSFGTEFIAMGAYKSGSVSHIACVSSSGRELLFAECSEFSAGEKLILNHSCDDGMGSMYTKTYTLSGHGIFPENVTCLRPHSALPSADCAVHALALAVEHNCESAAMSLLAPGLKGHLSLKKLKDFFGSTAGVERRLGGTLLKYPAGNFVYAAKKVTAELTGGLISNITMD